VYASNCLKLCTMYDSHGVYLRVLWTICMYKFSITHVVVFHDFFHSIYRISAKIGRFLTKTVRNSPRRFIGKTGRFITETDRISVFSVFTVPLLSLVRFGRFFLFSPIFPEFFKNRRVMSDFPCSTDFSNTDYGSSDQDLADGPVYTPPSPVLANLQTEAS
jgi:hypothetical protein